MTVDETVRDYMQRAKTIQVQVLSSGYSNNENLELIQIAKMIQLEEIEQKRAQLFDNIEPLSPTLRNTTPDGRGGI